MQCHSNLYQQVEIGFFHVIVKCNFFFCACVVGGFTSLTITDFWVMRLCCLTIFAEVSGSYIFTSSRLAQESASTM